MSEAYKEGYRAYGRGAYLNANPYSQQTEYRQWCDWRSGMLDAERDYRRE